MCGLISILDWQAGKWDSSLQATKAVQRGIKAMAYRGLRSSVIQHYNTIMGHVRLPIINLSEEADQPMEENGTIGMFVGEIFNYKELEHGKDALCDTEVLVRNFD